MIEELNIVGQRHPVRSMKLAIREYPHIITQVLEQPAPNFSSAPYAELSRQTPENGIEDVFGCRGGAME
jgi:hypothetical protein